MGCYDYEYFKLVDHIKKNGYSNKDENIRPKWADGTPAYTRTVLNYQLKWDYLEVPILTSKHVAWKTAIKEILWIWQLKSNKLDDLRKLNGTDKTVWDEWELPDGTIGKSYGHQLGKKCRKYQFELRAEIGNNNVHKSPPLVLDQVDYLINELKYNPSSRRLITTLWTPEDLDDMSLEPCVWNTHWQVLNQKLHLTVNIRSNDIGLGHTFNVFQYYVLHRMIAQVTGHKVGTIVFNIDNAHIYDRHFETIKEQKHTYDNSRINQAPKLWINPEIKNFYDFTIDDFKLIDYKHNGKFNMEVAI